MTRQSTVNRNFPRVAALGFLALAMGGALTLSHPESAQASEVVNFPARTCGPDQTVRISWYTYGTSTQVYYLKNGVYAGQGYGPWSAPYRPGTYNTGQRVTDGGYAYSTDDVITVGTYCA